MYIDMGKKEKKKREEYMLRNGGLLLEKRISYFDGKYSNPIRSFSAKELQKATENYNQNLISGSESSYNLYKGFLEGRAIFVKKYFDYCLESSPERVSNGISVAAQMSHHKNALKLLGCCLETPIPTPVFEFPEKGNLDDRLTLNQTRLPWKIKLKIANEIASVITYLHTAFPRPIIHRDLRLQHVYLDENLGAKLSDFMHCMTLPEGETQVKGDFVMGFLGSMAPEVAWLQVYSEKSDVFCFGKLLLGLITGKNCYFGLSEIMSTIDCITYHIRNPKINKIEDRRFLAQAEAVLHLILKCLRDNAEERPIMLDVAKQLRRIQRGDFISNGADHDDASSSSKIGCPNKQL